MDRARQRFNTVAVPALREQFYDFETEIEHHAVTSTGTVVTTGRYGHWRGREVFRTENQMGHTLERDRAELNISTDPFEGGIEQIDLRDFFVRDGVQWEIDNEDGRGIISRSPSTWSISLVAVDSIRQATPNTRLE